MANLVQVTSVFSAANPASTFTAAWTSAIRMKTALHLSVSADRVTVTIASPDGEAASTQITVTVGYTSVDDANTGSARMVAVAGTSNAADFLSTPTRTS